MYYQAVLYGNFGFAYYANIPADQEVDGFSNASSRAVFNRNYSVVRRCLAATQSVENSLQGRKGQYFLDIFLSEKRVYGLLAISRELSLVSDGYFFF